MGACVVECNVTETEWVSHQYFADFPKAHKEEICQENQINANLGGLGDNLSVTITVILKDSQGKSWGTAGGQISKPIMTQLADQAQVQLAVWYI